MKKFILVSMIAMAFGANALACGGSPEKLDKTVPEKGTVTKPDTTPTDADSAKIPPSTKTPGK